MASFEELQSLAEVVSKNKVKHIHVIGNPDSKHTKFEQFYDALASGRFQNDEEAAQFFYQASPNHAAYRKLKDRLQERMVNTLFFVDVNQPNFNEHNQAYYYCSKQMLAVRLLIASNARQAGIPLAIEALKLAIEYEFTEFIIPLARDLQLYYGTIIGQRKKLYDMNKVILKYKDISTAEIEAEAFYAEIMSYFVNSKSTKIDLKQTIEKYSDKIENLLKHLSSPRLNFYGYLVLTLRYEIIHDYINTLKVCHRALEYLEPSANKISISNIFIFAIKILAYQIYLGNFEAGKDAIKRCLKFSRVGAYNWFMTLEYAVILTFYSKEFQDAYDLYYKATNHSNFEKQPVAIRERWYILEAFVYFFLFTKKLEILEENPLKKFRLSKFLNEVPIYSKDKRGANISILILQVLFLLHQKKYNEIIDRAESLKTYTYRYLRRDDTFRSHCFIRMLLTLPDCSFYKAAVLRKADKYWQQLQAMPLNVARQSAEVEIVPYETLWEFVLEEL